MTDGRPRPRSVADLLARLNSAGLYFARDGAPLTIQEYLALDTVNYSRVGLARVASQIFVSTVWLGLRHGYDERGRPLIFETAVFRDYGLPSRTMLHQRRYATLEDAERGHAELVSLYSVPCAEA